MTMDDSEHICPLCCEELDISDREFYPCKCGYQVCMWCWHRIREQETGLCPACRTPYGEDPHQFTALDVEEVLKANKEAQAVAKRERHQLQQLQNQTISVPAGVSSSSSASASAQITSSSSNAVVSETASVASGEYDLVSTNTMDMPKDRTQLVNMRVIRRNLIYAVGLPPNIATEETLRKPEYFGQYGKIAKIVLNRSQTISAEGGDPRRASASAYVTFQYKEDTLACILAVDGFYLDNRNIRASYGTSKYCSAFIKYVRCNNPECTYLHEMGAAEDTFTKQEIQAGYVTSGRDVLARQQQIVAEQLQQQMLSATGGTHLPPRKRIGGGGPSGTGKACANPVFPPPEFDEPVKQNPSVVQIGISRSASTATSSASHLAALMNPSTANVKASRAVSIGGSPSAKSPLLGSSNPIRQQQSGTAGFSPAAATTAASVVAGGRSSSKDSADGVQPHSTLTALTPLKRTSVKSGAVSKAPAVEEKQAPNRNGKKQNGARSSSAVGVTRALSSSSTAKSTSDDDGSLVASIGGEVIGPPLSTIGAAASIGASRFDDGNLVGAASLSELGGVPIPLPMPPNSLTPNRNSAASLLGGEIFHGPLLGQKGSATSVVGGSGLLQGSALLPTASMSASIAASDGSMSRGSSSLLWASEAAPGPQNSGVIGSHIASRNSSGASSALASILGVNLPTGSGSLQESTSFWSSMPHVADAQTAPAPLLTLNGGTVHQQNHRHQGGDISLNRTVGPPQPFHTGSAFIGGVPISNSTSNFNGAGTIGNGVGDQSHSDIALLQSLLPGVHITTDNTATNFGGGTAGWNGPTGHSHAGSSAVSGDSILPLGSWVGGTNRLQTSTGGSAVGAIGHSHGQQNQTQGHGIW